MKTVRCMVPSHQVDQLVDALNESGIPLLRVTGGGWRRRPLGRRVVYAGCEYDVSLTPEVLIDVSAADCALDEVLRVVATTCGITGDALDAQVVVMSLDQS